MKSIAVQDLAAADARLKAAQLPWFDGLSEAEREALADYKGRAGRAMNAFLRDEDPELVEFATSTTDLRNALQRATAPEDLILYRGIGSAEADLYLAMAPGAITRARAFVSASIASYIAFDIARLQSGIVVEMLVRKGQGGVAYVNPFPTYRYPQYEVLMNPGSALKRVHANGGAIRLEVVDDGGSE